MSGSERKKEGKSIEGVGSKEGRERRDKGGKRDSRLTLQGTLSGRTPRGNNHTPRKQQPVRTAHRAEPARPSPPRQPEPPTHLE